MSKIVFFSIPAYGHTNPTIEVVRELSQRGHDVWYYSFNMFKEKIEDAGAKFISCDDYLPEFDSKTEKKIGKDFSALIEMVVDTTISLEEKVCRELSKFNPDCIVSDSICFWGKLFAEKMNIKYICSTTTFAFNRYTAKMMKRSLKEIILMLLGMGGIKKRIKLLQERGYKVENFISILENDNDTNTIVYTSKEFQPMVETFSDKYSFIGPSVADIVVQRVKKERKKVYISLGTLVNKNIEFYKNCIEAFKYSDFDIVMSVGENTEIDKLGNLPDNFEVKHSVNQIIVLQNTDVFITHCGMNSVNESLYYGVPMVLFPQHGEERMVANRVSELGAGIILKKNSDECIKDTVLKVMNKIDYAENAKVLAESFKNAGGAKKAADKIANVIKL